VTIVKNQKSQKHYLYRILQENVSINPDFCNFRTWLDSSDVSDSCHVIVEHYLARR